MLQTSLLLMKSLNKTETFIFLSVVCSLFPKAIFLTFIVHVDGMLSRRHLFNGPASKTAAKGQYFYIYHIRFCKYSEAIRFLV